MTTEKFVETSVTVKLSNRIHPVDDILLTYPFGMELQMTTGYENGTFDTRWENDQISFQRGMYFFPWYWDLFTGHWLKNYVLLQIVIVVVCSVLSSQRFTRHSMLSCHNK